jgi:tyrosyl-tRNA synthetase
MTFPLLTTATGAKMGKTASGAVWLDAELLSPYDFFQYWINCDDRDVERFLKLFTLLPMDEIQRLSRLQGSEIRQAKQVLAFEATRITHGEEAASEAQEAAAAIFGAASLGAAHGQVGGDLDAMPTTSIPATQLAAGISPVDLFAEVGLSRSKSEARRLLKQGGMYVNDQRIESLEQELDEADLTPEGILLRAGKKKYHRIVLE